jgi:hypothetical protein
LPLTEGSVGGLMEDEDVENKFSDVPDLLANIFDVRISWSTGGGAGTNPCEACQPIRVR